jgi:hypothetical protein
MTIDLTDREVAIICACLSRCEGWDDPRELERFVNVAAEAVRGGFSEAEMHAVHGHLADAHRGVGEEPPTTKEADVIAQVCSHWFAQGGEAQFGPIRECQNADEVISAILEAIRRKHPARVGSDPAPPTTEPQG